MDTGWVMVVWCVKFSFYPLSCLLKPKGNKKFLLGRTRYTENMRKSLFILLSCSNKFSYEMCYMSRFHFLPHIQRQIISMVPNFASFWSPIRIIWLILFSWAAQTNQVMKYFTRYLYYLHIMRIQKLFLSGQWFCHEIFLAQPYKETIIKSLRWTY